MDLSYWEYSDDQLENVFLQYSSYSDIDLDIESIRLMSVGFGDYASLFSDLGWTFRQINSIHMNHRLMPAFLLRVSNEVFPVWCSGVFATSSYEEPHFKIVEDPDPYILDVITAARSVLRGLGGKGIILFEPGAIKIIENEGQDIHLPILGYLVNVVEEPLKHIVLGPDTVDLEICLDRALPDDQKLKIDEFESLDEVKNVTEIFSAYQSRKDQVMAEAAGYSSLEAMHDTVINPGTPVMTKIREIFDELEYSYSELDDGRLMVRNGSASIFVDQSSLDLISDSPKMIKIESPLLRDVNLSQGLYKEINNLTFMLPPLISVSVLEYEVGKKFLGKDVKSLLIMRAGLLESSCNKDSVGSLVALFAGLADDLDDKLQSKFGGIKSFDD